MMKDPISQIKEEFATRFGLDVQIELYVHQATEAQAAEVEKAYGIMNHGYRESETFTGNTLLYGVSKGELQPDTKLTVFYNQKELTK